MNENVPKVVGRYSVYGEIAAGGMATVHIGRLSGVGGFTKTVAVKRLHPQFSKDPEFVTMFLDEARLAARIQHTNVVSTLDVVATGGELMLVMEYVQGEPLSRLARGLKALNERCGPRVAAAIMAGALHGLHAAHEAKGRDGRPLHLVHRDISPQNILVGADGVPRVLDFGVAKAANRAYQTRESTIKGKLAYMAPEVFQMEDPTRQWDIYGAAVVLWETLVGERLFSAENDALLLAKVLEGRIRSPRSIVPEVPEALDAIVMKGLERSPGRRYQSAEEMALALEASGIAAPSEVATLVKRVSGVVLEKRSSMIAEIESGLVDMRPRSDPPADGAAAVEAAATVMTPSPVANASRAEPAPPSGRGVAAHTPSRAGSSPDLGGETRSSLSREVVPGAPRESRRLVVAAVLGVAVLLGLVAGLVARPSLPTVAHAPPPVAPPVSATTEPVLPTVVLPIESTPVASLESTPTAPRASATPKPVVRTATVAAPTTRATPTPAAKDRGGCTPPYTLDAAGRKHFKLECVDDGSP